MTTQSNILGRKPTHRLFRVVGDGKNSIWAPSAQLGPTRTVTGLASTAKPSPSGRIVMRAITERSAFVG